MQECDVILLDKVQKNIRITSSEHKLLKTKNLVEGRYPNIFISSRVASITGGKTTYIKKRGFDDKYYQDLLINYLKQYKLAKRNDIDELLLEKLPDVLTKEQKLCKIKNILYSMSKKQKLIKNNGGRKFPVWILEKEKL